MAKLLLILFFATLTGAAQPQPRVKGNAAERFRRMSPEQRRRALDRLPPQRRAQIEQQLEQYDRMPPEERQRLQKRYEAFQQLPRDRQQRVRQAFREFRQVPQPRRAELRRELVRIQQMVPTERGSYLRSDQFRRRFSPEEQQVLIELADVPEITSR